MLLYNNKPYDFSQISYVDKITNVNVKHNDFVYGIFKTRSIGAIYDSSELFGYPDPAISGRSIPALGTGYLAFRGFIDLDVNGPQLHHFEITELSEGFENDFNDFIEKYVDPEHIGSGADGWDNEKYLGFNKHYNLPVLGLLEHSLILKNFGNFEDDNEEINEYCEANRLGIGYVKDELCQFTEREWFDYKVFEASFKTVDLNDTSNLPF